MLALAFKKIGDAFFVPASDEFRRLIFRARLTAAKMVQANIGHDAVEPGVEAALEAEAMKVAVNLEEGFLINVGASSGRFIRFRARRRTSRSKRRTNSSKAARLPACASATKVRSSRLGKEVTETGAAFVLPEQPLSSAKAKAHLESCMIRFLFARGQLSGCRTTP